ncbi:MAG TPA: hypothetical protein VFA10_01845 [Ktedonobacteraceae bacterium]|nr:hypothetical protein [Ktedonobacteraceae bacterium]
MVKQLAPACSASPQAQSAPAAVNPGHNHLLPIVANILAPGQAMISSCLPFQAVVSSIHKPPLEPTNGSIPLIKLPP